METPCVKICSIDPATRLCIGCWRTLDEIGRWSQIGSDERRRIMSEAPRRRERSAGGVR